MVVREAKETDQLDWNEFVLHSPFGSFLQTWQWGNMQNKLGAKTWRVLVADDNRIVTVALVIKRSLPFGRSWLYVPRGPVMPEDMPHTEYLWRAITERLIEIAEEEKSVFIRIDPGYPKLFKSKAGIEQVLENWEWQKAEREVQPKQTMLLDLTQSEEQVLAHMHSKTRYNIRLAKKKGVAIRFSSLLGDVKKFLALSHEVSGRTQFRYHPDEYYRAMLQALNEKNPITATRSVSCELGIAEHKNDILAVHMMVYAGSTATYVHGASSNKKRNLMAPLALYWETIKRAKQQGCEVYDFFGVAPQDATDDHPWAGITRVKKGFGGTYQPYIGAYDLVLDNTLYQFLNMAKRVRRVLHV